jgi:hypothetical protein
VQGSDRAVSWVASPFLVFCLNAWIAPVVRARAYPPRSILPQQRLGGSVQIDTPILAFLIGIDLGLSFAKIATLSLFWHLIALYLFQTLDLVLSLRVTGAL